MPTRAVSKKAEALVLDRALLLYFETDHPTEAQRVLNAMATMRGDADGGDAVDAGSYLRQ